MLGLLNTAILLSQATTPRTRVELDPEGYRVANVAGEYLSRWKARALAAEAERDVLEDAQADLLTEIADLEAIVAHLTAERDATRSGAIWSP
ncbi:hypothetical protein [uncultured Limimaricola sp.]|uniref:hypothetical protein n=1 Tax=uncultured Limimaricola sp. TaxID=2211667 RepID=UPI0030F80AB9